MAAFAALTSLMHIVEQIRHHPRPPITFDKQQIESLCENVSFFTDFLENYLQKDIGDRKEALESRIGDAAYAAEDIIESHIVDEILAKSKFHVQNNFINLFCRGVKKMIGSLACSPDHKTDQILTGDMGSNILFCQDFQKVIEDMNLIKKDVIEIQEKIRGKNDDHLPRHIISMSANITGSSTVPPPKWKNANIMVGIEDVLIEIMDMLTGHQTARQILSIVGMGGIGKTTLARNVYDHQYITSQFEVRIWVTISQEYRIQDILLKALSYLGLQNDENNSSDDELGHLLYKRLCGRRYLIILDDMWSIEAWEELMFFFPDNHNGSRIMITTRLSNVSNHFGSCGFKMNFLDEDKSWNLLCKIVFAQDQCCYPELVEIGKKIARNCRGLPLSIVIIGGLLANSEKTQLHWEYIAENLNPIINLEGDMHCLKILYLSYNNLPIHLKPCFLYMGVFPEDTTIPVSWLKKLWVAEGFLKPIAAKSLEVVAEEYLKDLIDRNLIFVHGLRSSGKVKDCKIHDLLRELCLREGEKDKFLWVRKLRDFGNLEEIQSQRRISVHKVASKEEYDIDRVLEALPSPLLARSLTGNLDVVRLLSQSNRLVRVFNAGSKYPYKFGKNIKYSLKDIFELVNSRYLDFAPHWKSMLPSSMHLLWNLQTLIIKGGVTNVNDDNIHLPPEIWEMSQLRHLEIGLSFFLPDPPKHPLIQEGDNDYFILRDLHTLKGVKNFKLSEEVIKRISNIKRLRVYYFGLLKGWGYNYYLDNLGLLNKLESLYFRLSFDFERSLQIDLAKNLTFPHALKKLTLYGTQLLWIDTRMIGSLPHLQVLKLKRESFIGSKWNPIEGEFLCLKFLLIEHCFDLVYWNANSTHFPCLEKLVLNNLDYLKEIPSDIGQIPTLRSIELNNCSNSAAKSAKSLVDELVELGIDDIQLRVTTFP